MNALKLVAAPIAPSVDVVGATLRSFRIPITPQSRAEMAAAIQLYNALAPYSAMPAN